MARRASIERAISCAVARAASAANLQDAHVNRLVRRVDEFISSAQSGLMHYTRVNRLVFRSGSDEGSYFRPIDFCITQL